MAEWCKLLYYDVNYWTPAWEFIRKSVVNKPIASGGVVTTNFSF